MVHMLNCISVLTEIRLSAINKARLGYFIVQVKKKAVIWVHLVSDVIFCTYKYYLLNLNMVISLEMVIIVAESLSHGGGILFAVSHRG